MPVTVNVNGLSLCHRQSGGTSMATLPDVCLTPGAGPVPYPNVAFSRDLAKGTTSVTADGADMCANFGSEFSQSTGDEPGTGGGLASHVNTREATWMTYSFDVKLEGRGACRLTDKMFHNRANTVNMGGLLQAPVEAWPQLVELCVIVCACHRRPVPSASGKTDLKQQCVENTLRAQDAAQLAATGTHNTMRPEVPYNMTTTPPTPLLHRVPGGSSLDPTESLPVRMGQDGLKPARLNRGRYDVRIPDVVVARSIDPSPAGATRSLTAPNLAAVVEIKFDEPRNQDQISDYERIAGSPTRVVELSPQECMCNEPSPKPVLEREFEREALRRRAPTAAPVFQPAPAGGGLLDLQTWEKITGLSGAALLLYLAVSEGSRLFPPRNLVPVP